MNSSYEGKCKQQMSTKKAHNDSYARKVPQICQKCLRIKDKKETNRQQVRYLFNQLTI